MNCTTSGDRGIRCRVSYPLLAIVVLASLTQLLVSCSGSREATQPSEDPLSTAVETRKQAYLEYCVSGEGSGGLHNEIARLALGKGPLNETVFQDALSQMEKRLDCSDFRVAALLRVMHQYRDSPLLSKALRDQIEQGLVNFKYWVDEKRPDQEKPLADEMVYWSENHQILFHSAEYLVGQLFPDRIFPNSGMTGRQHIEKAKGLIEEWLSRRARIGFSEWHSNVYYDEDLCALFNLADFADDPVISQKAVMIVDLLLMDIGLHTHLGVFGSTHGRSYEKDKMSGRGDDTACVAKITWDQGDFNSRSSQSGVSLAVSSHYQVPTVLAHIGKGDPIAWADRERMGITIEDAEEYGFNYQDFRSGIFWWGMGGYAPWQVIELTIRMADAYNLWENEFLKYFEIGKIFLGSGCLPKLSKALYPLATGSVLGQVNTYTYRTPEYMLSCVQDYLPGYVGFQQHVWQATLGLDAVVFTTHPGPLPESVEMVGEWTGNASMPRTAQFKNVLVAIYDPIMKGLFSDYTHAYFPKKYFDEVMEKPPWIFGRKGDGYIALYSENGYSWQDEGPYADEELIAQKAQNVWICELGRTSESGPFEAFSTAISHAPLQVEGFDVRYVSPSQGEISFGWQSPLTVKGAPVELGRYPRYDNPYCTAPFGATQITVEKDSSRLFLDFERWQRKWTMQQNKR